MSNTLPTFTQYVPPGVYWQQTSTPSSTSTTGLPNGVAIIGPGIGYRTYSEAVTLNGTTAVQLTKQGITSVTSVNSGQTVYSSTTDYQITTVPGPDGTAPEVVTSIVRRSGSISDGATVNVSYKYADAAYFAPATNVTDFQSVVNLYGSHWGDYVAAVVCSQDRP